MDASNRPQMSRRQVSSASSRYTRWLVFLCGFPVLLLGITLVSLGFSRNNTAYSAPQAHLEASPTPSSGPPTLTLAVPASGQGPVGAHITIIGSSWGTSDVQVGAAAPGGSCADPNGWVQTFNHVRPGADQSIVFSFDWPTSLTASGGAYLICAVNGAGVANTSYQVVSSSAPTLTVNPPTTNAGSVVTISGANFTGSGSVTLSVTNAGSTRELTTISPDASGAFSLQYQPRPTDVGDVVLRAFTSSPQGMRPALDTSTKLHIGPPLTPTVSTTPTVTVAVANPNGNNDSALVLVVVGIAFGLLALLAVAGVIVFFVMRNRNNPGASDAAAPENYGGSGPGYGRPGNVYSGMYQDEGYGGATSYMGNPEGDTTQGGFSRYEQGGYPPQTGYGSGVGGWAESDEPDPNWRPRPMTGQWRGPTDYSDVPFDNYGPDESGRYPPQDPWGAPDDSYGRPSQPYGSGQNYGGSSRDAGGYPPPGPRNRGSGAGPRDASRGGYPERRPDDDW